MTPTGTHERAFERALRDKIMEEIESQGLSASEVAERTGMLMSGVGGLFERKAWPLDVAFRVANGLGLEVRPALDRR